MTADLDRLLRFRNLASHPDSARPVNEESECYAAAEWKHGFLDHIRISNKATAANGQVRADLPVEKLRKLFGNLPG